MPAHNYNIMRASSMNAPGISEMVGYEAIRTSLRWPGMATLQAVVPMSEQ